MDRESDCVCNCVIVCWMEEEWGVSFAVASAVCDSVWITICVVTVY